MISYTLSNYGKLLTALMEHLELVGLTLLISIPLAIILSMLVKKNQFCHSLIFGFLLLVYCIPSIALFSLLIPAFGLGKTTAIIGMTAYNQILLLRNITAAYKAIPLPLQEAADSMGLTNNQKFIMIDLPIMMPYLIAGIRIATVSTTGIASVAALINAGGLGNILFEGMRMNHMPKIIWGILLISGLALLLNALFARLERKAIYRSTGGKLI